MKDLIEIINEFVVKHPLNNSEPGKITINRFLKDIEQLFTGLGIQVFDISGTGYVKNIVKDNPVVYKNAEKATQWDNVDCSGDITTYTLQYSQENDYNKTNGFAMRENSFKLVFKVWYDDNLERPRYRVDDFRLLLPGTNHQGYGISSLMNYKNMSYSIHFPAKKVVPEYYEMAKNAIKDLISIFVANTKNMQNMFDKCHAKEKQPQRADYYKLFNSMYGKIIVD